MATAEEDEVRDRVVRIIDRLMYEENMSAEAIAGVLEIHSARLTEWKKGKGAPTVKTLVRLCDEFSISGAYLLTGTQETGITDMAAQLKKLQARVEKLESKAGSKKG